MIELATDSNVMLSEMLASAYLARGSNWTFNPALR